MPKSTTVIRVLAFLLCVVLCAGIVFAATASATADTTDPAEQLARMSGLPVLCLWTQSGEQPVDEREHGKLVVLKAREGALDRITMHIEINLRGNTSKRFPKNSYRVKIVDEYGEKLNIPIAGLRSDDDWILNPMYTDTSKIREALAYKLWSAINSSGDAAASSRLSYAEVFLNGEYWGLYGVQERVDRKQVDGDKATGVLYKVVANDRPSVADLLHCVSAESCGGIQLEFAGKQVVDPWKPAAAYMAALSGEPSPGGATLDRDNIIDFGLWAMLTQAHDCHFKNQFLNCVEGADGYTMYKIPWDLNNTFGDIWQNDALQTNHTGYSVGKLVMDSSFEQLINSGDKEIYKAIQARWTALRTGTITEDALISLAHELYDPLFDAIERDGERWRQSGMGDGNARNIRDIEDYIRLLLPRMDEYIARLGSVIPSGRESNGEDMDR